MIAWYWSVVAFILGIVFATISWNAVEWDNILSAISANVIPTVIVIIIDSICSLDIAYDNVIHITLISPYPESITDITVDTSHSNHVISVVSTESVIVYPCVTIVL